ncbi:MAG: hypothetical protein K2K70_07160 [Lachnospiraceae bacterium]|nr:hypothetical protein [Lachnospiraceae bacterium]
MSRISQPNLLYAVFSNVYGIDFQADNLEHRIMLQKAVFFMREQGVSCGDYEFVWDQFGPFSAELSDDMKMEVDESLPPVEFNQEAIAIMDCLRKAFSFESTYSVRYWAEAIASLLYLKRYIYPSYTDDEIIDALEVRKTGLREHEENIKAMKTLKGIIAI